jgi:hypothetical protein
MEQDRFVTRSSELIAVEVDSLLPTLPDKLKDLKVKANAAGRLYSGATAKQMYQAASDSLRRRSEVILESIKRTHSSVVATAGAHDREACQSFAHKMLVEQADCVMKQVDDALTSIFDEQTLGRFRGSISVPIDLISRKLAVELDLYFDHVEAARDAR